MNYQPCDYNTLAGLIRQQYAFHQQNMAQQVSPVNIQNRYPIYQTHSPIQYAQLPIQYAQQPIQYAQQPIQYAQQPIQYAQQPAQQPPYVVYMLMQIPYENRTESCYVPVLFNSPEYPILPYEYGIVPQAQNQYQPQIYRQPIRRGGRKN